MLKAYFVNFPPEIICTIFTQDQAMVDQETSERAHCLGNTSRKLFEATNE